MRGWLAVAVIVWGGLALYYLAGAPGWLRIRREGRESRARQEQQIAARIADATPDEVADLLTPSGAAT